MPFSPEHFMREDVNPLEWAKLRSDSMARFTATMESRRKDQEQTRQFEEEQARLREQQDNEQLKYQSGLTLQKEQLDLDRQKVAIDAAKFDYKAQAEQDAIEREGVKTLLKAWTDSEEGKEFDAAAQMISETHDIEIVARGAPPSAGVQETQAAEAGMMPQEPGMAPPPGMAPTDGEAPPPGTEWATDAQGNRVPVATDRSTPEGKARAEEEQAMIDDLPPGEGVTAAGLDASKTITSGAAAVVAAAGGGDLGIPPNVADVPAEPDGAQTAEEAAATDRENPVVDPDQEMPAADASELSRRLENQKPITQVEVNDRVATDMQVKASYEKRMKTLQAAGLTPIQLAIAANWAAAAHDLPPVPIPSPAPDPNVPADQQGNGAFDVELSPEIEALAKAPPELEPSIVRDGRLSGGYDFYSRRTGKKLGTLDWNEVQESRFHKRMKGWRPIIDIADNPRDKERLQTMVEMYARNGDKKSFDVVMQYIGKLYGREAAIAQGGRRDADQERKDSAESRAAMRDMKGEMARIKGDMFKNEGLDEMKKAIQSTDRTLTALNSSPNSTEQRKVMADFLADMYGRRATDQDANRGLRDNLWTDVMEMKDYLIGSGKLSPKRMAKMKQIIVEVNKAEKNKRAKMAEYLHEQVMNGLSIQTDDQDLAKNLAQQAVLEAFPELEHDVVVRAIGASNRRRRERLSGRLSEPEEIPLEELTPDDI